MNLTKNTLAFHPDLADMLNDSSIDRVMAIDASWNIIAWNRTSEMFSGHTKSEVLGRHLLDLFPKINEDEEMLTAIRDAFNGFKSFLPSSTGAFNRHYVENHFIPLKDAEGNICGVMNIMHDVAHRLKVEKQLLKLNTELAKRYEQLEKANHDLAAFTDIASRDLKEPIKHVYTSLEFLARKEGMNLSNASKGNLRKMQASLNRMNLLLDDILAISRVSNYKSKLECVDLNTVLQNVIEPIADKLNAKSVTINYTELPAVSGSPDMLHYLLNQLIDNAIKFQPQDNRANIDIKSALIDLDDDGERSGEYHEISVTDNGIGFEACDAERIFNMFERIHENKYRGSGIGLAICKKIMDVHEGMISAESKPDVGSTFKIYFPVIDVD